MQIGLVGLGRMGAGMAARLMAAGHDVSGYDLSAENSRLLDEAGGTSTASLEDLVAGLSAPRAVWVMVPHGAPTRETVAALIPLLSPGDVLVDGGNSHYPESIAHGQDCDAHEILFLDVGVSGGVWGEREGFNLMIGGPAEAFSRLEPLFAALTKPGGYAHVGPSGAGHFVKMIHNAIEYAMLQAIGEGFECLQRSPFELDLARIASLWQNGSVVRSWLLDLLGRAFEQEGNALAEIGDYVDDSGTGRWTVEYALKHEIPVPSISVSLFERFDSRLEKRFSHQVIAALRNQFGGHAVMEEKS